MSRKIERFIPESLLNDFFRLVLVAPSNYGKTYYLLYLIEEILIKEYKFIFLISTTKNPLYKKVIWPNHYFIVGNKIELDESIKSIITFGNTIKTKDGSVKHKKILIVFDDLGMLTRHSTEITNIFIRGRNSLISSIWAVQSYQMIDKCLRCNITHTGIYAFSEDLTAYISAVPLPDSKKVVMAKIQNIFKSLNNENKIRPIVMLCLVNKDIYTWTNIPPLDYDVTQKNILHLQYSKMMNKSFENNDDIYIK